MGFLKHLLFWPVTGPLFLAEFSLDRVQGVVREELTDDTRIKAELMELQLKLELGDIDDDQYLEEEARLMRELREIRQWREQFGMGVAGGPVRVQAAPDETAQVDAAGVVAHEGSGDAGAGDDERATAGESGPRVADPGGGADIELNLDWD
jgi:hypothetical protein